jgi:hypothetical protein
MVGRGKASGRRLFDIGEKLGAPDTADPVNLVNFL